MIKTGPKLGFNNQKWGLDHVWYEREENNVYTTQDRMFHCQKQRFRMAVWLLGAGLLYGMSLEKYL